MGGTPYCVDSGGSADCRECTLDVHCPDTFAPVCRTSTPNLGTCVECNNSLDCRDLYGPGIYTCDFGFCFEDCDGMICP
jgi:hypothetical protein